MFRIEVSVKDGFADPRAEGLQKDIGDLGVTSVKQVRVSDIYLLEGNPAEAELNKIGRELLADPIVAEYTCRERPLPGDAQVTAAA